jgi:hypothetical protein
MFNAASASGETALVHYEDTNDKVCMCVYCSCVALEQVLELSLGVESLEHWCSYRNETVRAAHCRCID